MKIALWAVVVFVAGYAVIAGAASFFFGRGGTVCTSSTEGWRNCEWNLGAAAFSGFFLVLFALLLFFSSRSLIQAIQESGMIWRTDIIVWQALLVICVLAALEAFRELMVQVVDDGPCFAPNPNGSIWMDGGRFEYAECEGSARETLLPVALIASLCVGAFSLVRLRNGQRVLGP